jgi:hypothetical protein
MASGDTVVKLLKVHPIPTSSGAYPSVLTGGSTPAEKFHVWTFPGADAYIDLLCQLEGYDGGGLTFKLRWSTTVTANNAVWQLAIRRFADDAETLTASHTYDFNTVTGAAPTAVSECSYDNVTFTNGADMDSVADGEMFILRVRADETHASDTLTATTPRYLWGWPIGVET